MGFVVIAGPQRRRRVLVRVVVFFFVVVTASREWHRLFIVACFWRRCDGFAVVFLVFFVFFVFFVVTAPGGRWTRFVVDATPSSRRHRFIDIDVEVDWFHELVVESSRAASRRSHRRPSRHEGKLRPAARADRRGSMLELRPTPSLSFFSFHQSSEIQYAQIGYKATLHFFRT